MKQTIFTSLLLFSLFICICGCSEKEDPAYKKNTLPVGKWEARLKASPHLQNYYDIAYEFISLKDSLLIEQYFPNGGMDIGISDYRITSLGKELFLTANLSNLNNQDVSALESQMDYLTANLQ